LCSLLHPQKASTPISKTLAGIETLVSPTQPKNALTRIIGIPSGTATSAAAPLYFTSAPARTTKSAAALPGAFTTGAAPLKKLTAFSVTNAWPQFPHIAASRAVSTFKTAPQL